LTDSSLQSADIKDQQESRSVAEKPHDAVEKFDTFYRNLQRHRAVLPAKARLLSCSASTRHSHASDILAIVNMSVCHALRNLQRSDYDKKILSYHIAICNV